jgi:hypothetical protein
VFGSTIERVSRPADIEMQCASLAGEATFMNQRRHLASETQVQEAYSKIALALTAYEASQAMSPFKSR